MYYLVMGNVLFSNDSPVNILSTVCMV